MNTQVIEHKWLSDLLAANDGILYTVNNVEIGEMPSGSFYVYCDHPEMAAERLPVQIGLCREFETLQQLMATLSFQTPEDLTQLAGKDLLPFYAMDEMSMSVYLSGED